MCTYKTGFKSGYKGEERKGMWKKCHFNWCDRVKTLAGEYRTGEVEWASRWFPLGSFKEKISAYLGDFVTIFLFYLVSFHSSPSALHKSIFFNSAPQSL